MSETFAYFLVEDTNTTALALPAVATDRVAVVRGDAPDEQTYYASPEAAARLTYVKATPLTGATLTAAEGQGAYVVVPAGALATLTVTLPPDPGDGQVFEISTTQTLAALTVDAPGGETVSGGTVGVLSGNGGCSWRYVEADTTWYRRY